MRGEIDRPKRPRRPKKLMSESDRGKGKRHREEEARRKKRTFSYMRLFGDSENTPLAQQRDSLLAKARHLAFPADASSKYKQVSVRKKYGRDISAGGSSGLPAFHKSALQVLSNDLLLCHNWPQLAGVLCVLLRALFAERDWNPQYSQYFWAAMEVIQQTEEHEGSDVKLDKIYYLLRDKQPKGPWSRWKMEEGAVLLEFALYLMSKKHYEEANLASEPFAGIPPYRDHPLANLLHGLIHYHHWFELVEQEVKQESERRVGGHLKRENMDFSEGVGENHGVLNDNTYKTDYSIEEYTFGLGDESLSEDTSTLDVKNNQGIGFGSTDRFCGGAAFSNLKEETPWNFYDDAEEDNEQSFMKKAKIMYTADLDRRLFPFILPWQYVGKNYSIPMGTAAVKNSHSTAVKHLRDTLTLEKHSTSALLPLAQLLLAATDVEGAYAEIEKCCHKFNDCDSFRIKCMLLESLSLRNNDMLITAYEEVLERDSSSVHPLERLIDMHKIGEYTTQALFQYLGLHLDACKGSVLIWKKLALCFQKLKESENELAKDTIKPTLQDALEVDFFQQESIMETWKLRKRWWLVKHFRSDCIEEELNAEGIRWLVFKAASAVHIYGSSVQYASEAEKHFQMLGNFSQIEKLRKHKENPFNLLAHFTTFECP